MSSIAQTIPKDIPLTPRLMQMLSQVSAITQQVGAFEQRLNGSHFTEANASLNTKVTTPQPSMSLEQIVSEIESLLRDLDSCHNRIASRF